MAERRMFSKTIIDSDAFIDMPLSTQALYFHLSMRADDDGFVNNPKKIQRMIGASDDDLNVLMMKRYILVFDTGVIVIKHWKIHNYIRNDRYKPTVYIEEMSQLEVKKNNSYTERMSVGIPNGYQMDTQDSIGKDSIGKVSKEERHRYGEYKNVLLSNSQMEKLKSEFPDDWESRIEDVSNYVARSGKTYKDYLAVIRNWAKKDKKHEEPEKEATRYGGTYL